MNTETKSNIVQKALQQNIIPNKLLKEQNKKRAAKKLIQQNTH